MSKTKQKIPKVCHECVATQLILRSVGFTTDELGVLISKNGKAAVTVALTVERGGKTDSIELGSIGLAHRTVLNNWEGWLGTAAKDLIDDMRDDKTLFYSLIAYKTMEKLFEHLEIQGFELVEAQIASTF